MKKNRIPLLLAALLLTACSQPWWQEGDFSAAGATFTPADPALSLQLDPEAFKRRVHSSKGGMRHCKKLPSKVGSHQGVDISIVTSMHDGFLWNSYFVTLITKGDGVDNEKRVNEGQTCYVTATGDIQTLSGKAGLPQDWVCLATLKGQHVFLAWNPKTGGANEVFTATPGGAGDTAVYKRLTQTPCGNLMGILSDCTGYTQLTDDNGIRRKREKEETPQPTE